MPRCPACSSSRVARVIYGEPSPEQLENPSEDVAFGGCGTLFDDDAGDPPAWRCLDCGEEFDR